jgi:hypothetical protein
MNAPNGGINISKTIRTAIKYQTSEHIAQQFAQSRPGGDESILDWLYADHHLLILLDTLRYTIRRSTLLYHVRGYR